MAAASIGKETRAVDAATETFMRYGFAKTTMADIAAKAAMSRPALYLLFPDKDALFDRVIRQMDFEMLDHIRGTIGTIGELKLRLIAACTEWGMHPFELTRTYPDAADLFDLRYPAVRDAYDNFGQLIIDLIQKDVERSGIQASAAELAKALIFGMKGTREYNDPSVRLERFIEVQVEILVRALRPVADRRHDVSSRQVLDPSALA